MSLTLCYSKFDNFSKHFMVTGKLDFLQELEKYKQTYTYFINAYTKLKCVWNKSSRSSSVHAMITEKMKCSIISPGPTRWNSEWDALKDAYAKRNGVNDQLYFKNMILFKFQFLFSD